MSTVDTQHPAGVDVGSITGWLAEHVGDVKPPLAFTRLKGGHSNLTYRVDDAASRRLVIRRPPLGDLLPTAHDMTREWRFISALHPTGVPVAPPLALCDDTSIIGAPFYVMEFVEGHVLHDSATVTAHYEVDRRRSIGLSFIEVLADMHAVDPDAVGLGDIARKEGYIARQLKRWYAQWNASKTRELPAVDEVHERLLSRIPDQGPARIVHGDYRLGNCITSADGRIAAVLDWEIATLGDPLADVGYAVSRWAEPGEEEEEDRGNPTLAPGFPSRRELLDAYANASGRDLGEINYYIAFAHWKLACIVEGVYARYLAGALDSTGIEVEAFKRSVDRAAELAAETISS